MYGGDVELPSASYSKRIENTSSQLPAKDIYTLTDQPPIESMDGNGYSIPEYPTGLDPISMRVW